MSEKFTFDQVNQQESTAYMNRSNTEPTVLVKRTDGRVTVGSLNKDTRTVSFSENGQHWEKPGLPVVEFSDQRQAELAAELAGQPLRSAEMNEAAPRSAEQKLGRQAAAGVVERPQPSREDILSNELDIIAAKYDQETGLNLWRYAAGVMNKRDAQRSGDGQASMDAGQQAGQALRELERVGGAEAKQDAERYLQLMRQLQVERTG